MTTILGIDPGMHGAWALLADSGGLLDTRDFPLIGTGARRRIDGAQMLREIHYGCMGEDISLAVIEQTNSMPKQGVASSFRFGFCCGHILGLIEGLAVPIVWTSPSRWKREMGLSSDKEASRCRAIETWPKSGALFARKKDHQRAEAALIALWHVRFGEGRAAA